MFTEPRDTLDYLQESVRCTVEHVHVHAGGQAVVGTVEAQGTGTPGGGEREKSEDQPHAKQVADAHQPALWSAHETRDAVSITRVPNGRCRMHGGKSSGAPRGNGNALKHGRYTAQAIARRKEIAVLLGAMKALATDAEDVS